MMIPSFHAAERPTHRRVMLLGPFCLAFVAISFSLRPQTDDGRVLVKADRLVHTTGKPLELERLQAKWAPVV
jgi:hypothetical protein